MPPRPPTKPRQAEPPDPGDLDALGAQYRDARRAIATHRHTQAQAELALARARRRLPADHPDVAAAEAAVARAHADVQWCRAVTVAAGEAFKGEPLDVVAERNEIHRAAQRAHRTGRG